MAGENSLFSRSFIVIEEEEEEERVETREFCLCLDLAAILYLRVRIGDEQAILHAFRFIEHMFNLGIKRWKNGIQEFRKN